MKIERKNSETTPVGTTFAPGAGRVAGPWPLRAAWLLWMVLACAVSVKAVMVPVAHSVYPCFEAGGRAWLAGIDLYPFCCEHEFRYGPVCAMALAPLARLPSAWGGLLWIWLDLGVFFWSVQALMRRILPGPWTTRRRQHLPLPGSARHRAQHLVRPEQPVGLCPGGAGRGGRRGQTLVAGRPDAGDSRPHQGVAAGGGGAADRLPAAALGGALHPLPGGRGSAAVSGETVRLGVPAILRMVLGAGGPVQGCATSIATPGRSGRRSTRRPKPTST